MARGGARPGAGRKPKKEVQALKKELKRKQTKAERVLDKPFDGDAHDLLILVYKDTDLPLAVRLDAAKHAIAFEKPRLAATALVSKGDIDAEAAKNQPRRPAGDRLKAMASAPLKVIEGSLAKKETENA